MAADNQLERIASLVDRLGPLAGKARGMRIEADDWNALVGIVLSLLQVERAQLGSAQSALEERFARQDHEHLGEVTTAWLDAELQGRVGGQDGSLSTRTSLAEMDRKIASLAAEVARLTTLVNGQQTLIDRSTIDELDRVRTLRQFEDRFAGLESLRTQMSTVSGDLGPIKSNIDKLLQLRQSLSDPAGNPIDIAKMRQDLTEVQDLRENLRGVDGKLLRVRDVEVRLAELSDAVGVGSPGSLETRIGGVVAAAEQRLDAKAIDRATTLEAVVHAEVATSENRLRGELSDGVNSSRAAIEQALGQQVAAAEGRLDSQLDGKLSQSTAAVRSEILAASGSMLNDRLAQLPDQIRTISTGVVADMRSSLTTDLHTALTAEADAKLDAFAAQLSGRVSTIESAVQGVQANLAGTVNAEVETFGQDLESRLNQHVDARVEASRQSLQGVLGAQVSAAVGAATTALDQRVAIAIDGQLANLDGRIAQSVAAATRTLPQDVAGEVGQQISALNLAGQIASANTALEQRLRTAQTQAISALQASTSSSVSSSVTLLRGEMTALRTEMLSTVDTRVNASNNTLRQELNGSLSQLRGSLRQDAFRNIVIATPVVGGPIT